MRSFETSEFARSIPAGAYHYHQHALAERLLRDCTFRVAIAADGVFLGWSVTRPALVHYVYVKPHFRRMGIGRALIAGVGNTFEHSHRTSDFRWLARGGTYNPYLLAAQ